MKPHGFEVNYVEGPITPAQAEEDAQLYDPETPFSQRIELGIQRFKQKRKMHEIYSRVFNKWMHFGGVDASPRQFAGKPQAAELEGLDAADRTHVMATHQVPANREDPGKWAVDFEGVARGFLSAPARQLRCSTTDGLAAHPTTPSASGSTTTTSRQPARSCAPSTTSSSCTACARSTSTTSSPPGAFATWPRTS